MNILITAATAYEIAPIIKFLEDNSEQKNFFKFRFNEHTIYPLVTGVGTTLTAFNMGRFTQSNEIDLAVNLGLAGSFNPEIELGEVVNVAKDRFADLGVEEKDESFTDVFELELANENKFPFRKGWIPALEIDHFSAIKKVNAITVNKVHGAQKSIQMIKEKYDADIESMEGAAFFYAANMMQIEYVQLRAISNYVEPRNKAAWKIDLAINNLSDAFVTFIRN